MSLAQSLTTYVTLNLIVLVAYGLLKVSSRAFVTCASQELRLHYRLLAFLGILTVVHPWIPKPSLFQPAAKVWSAPSLKAFAKSYSAADKGGYLTLPTGSGYSMLEADKVSWTLRVILSAVLLYGIFRLGRDLYDLFKIRRNAFLVRKVGRVAIYVSDTIAVPFSYWLPWRNDVVVPQFLMERELDFRMAVSHELQHHRQRDTRWIYVLWGLRILCVINPFIHWWNRWISEIQEFACDETLVDRKKVESRQYMRCLIEVAETAFNQRGVPVCATGLTFLVERQLLKRRIEKMISISTRKNRSMAWVTGGLVVALVTVTAWASQGIVHDRRVTLAEAEKMAIQARSESDFPLTVNDLVLKQLNRYIGTPEGREYMRNALRRMENYRPLVESKLAQYQVPSEIMALPIIESGYQNLAPNNKQGWGAGLWMFIARTARNFGLRVDKEVDDRLNVEILTDAAMRYLKGGQLKFNDWLLSVLAYNLGEQRVLDAIDKTGSRDAWVLVRRGYENDKDYLPGLVASILIMRNPKSVE